MKRTCSLFWLSCVLAACNTDPGISAVPMEDDSGGSSSGSGTSGSGSGTSGKGSGTSGNGSGTGGGASQPGFKLNEPTPAANVPMKKDECGFEKFNLERKPAELLLVLDRSGR
jgi:hypothetical protein